MTCLEVQEILCAFIDEELDEEQMHNVQEHIEKCSSCKKEAEELKNIITKLLSFEDVPTPEAFNDRLHKALVVEGQNIRKLEIITIDAKKKLNWKRISSIAAVFLVGLFSIILYNDNLDDFNKQDLDNMSYSGEYTVESTEDSEMKESQIKDIISDKSTEKIQAKDTVDNSEAQYSDVVESIEDNSLTEETNGKLRNAPKQEIASYSQHYLDSVEQYQTPESINVENSIEEINRYLEELDKILNESNYIVNSYTRNDEENMWIIDVTIITITSEGKEVKEKVVYCGQDGKVWKKEL